MEPANIRILIAEDHAVVRDGLASLLSYKHFEVAAVSNGEEAVERFQELRPDVVLMDLRMPKLGGAEATAAIRAIDPEAKIIVLTTYSGDEDIHRALRAGARGYLLKEATTEELVSAVKAVSAGETVIPASVANQLIERSTTTSLTPREAEILSLIAKGMSNKEIANNLVVSEGTVKTHVNSLLEKLNVSDRTEALVTGLRRGLIQLD